MDYSTGRGDKFSPCLRPLCFLSSNTQTNTSTNFVIGFVSAHFNQPSYFTGIKIQSESCYSYSMFYLTETKPCEFRKLLMYSPTALPYFIQIAYLTIQTDDRQEFYVVEYILGKQYWKTTVSRWQNIKFTTNYYIFFCAPYVNKSHHNNRFLPLLWRFFQLWNKVQENIIIVGQHETQKVARLKMYLLLLRVKTINGYLPNSTYSYLSKPCGFLALEANAVLTT